MNDKKPPILVKFIIFLICFILVFVTDRPQAYHTNFDNYLSYTFVSEGFIFSKFLSIFDLSIILFSFYLILKKYSLIRYANKYSLIFIVFTYLTILFKMINPNNHSSNPIFGLSLFSDPSNITAMICTFTILCLREDYLIMIVKWFLYPAIILITIRSIFLLSLFSIGFIEGIDMFGGYISILIDEDVLIFFLLVQLCMLTYFFLSKKKIYLFLSLMIVIIQILSFRRSPFFLTILCNILLFLLYYKQNILKNKHSIVSMIVLLIGLITILYFTNIFLTQKLALYISRYFGAFFDLPGSYYNFGQDVYYNEHLEESFFALENIIDVFPFWGIGYGEDYYDYLYKGSTGIHNAYIAAWHKYGILPLLYYISIFSYAIYSFIYTNLNREKYYNLIYYYRLTSSLFLIMFMGNAWVMILQSFIGIKMIFIWTLMLAFLFKTEIRTFRSA